MGWLHSPGGGCTVVAKFSHDFEAIWGYLVYNGVRELIEGLGVFRGVGLMVEYRPNAQGVFGLLMGSSSRPLHGLKWPQKTFMITSGQEVWS